MAQFSIAIPFFLAHEGGFSETPAGEVVNRGINTDTLKALGYPGDKAQLTEIVRNLTVAQTEDIYQKFYWTFKAPSIQNALDQLHTQSAGNKILDMCVLSGQITAIKLVQRTLGLVEDGIFGPNTLAATQNLGVYLAPKLATTWSHSLSDIADHNIATAQKAGNTELVAYWSQVKVGWLARASWDGINPKGNSL